MVEKEPDGPRPTFARTEPEAVFGILRSRRRPLSVAEMDAAIRVEARRRAAEAHPESLQSGGGGRKVCAGGDETAGD